jgi:UDP-4-amino-4,6-dideoxy-N-acetyl-beta-L-altrosamine transaminase
LPYGKHSIDGDDVSAVAEVLTGDWLTQGPEVKRFEAALRSATGAGEAVAVQSGTAALHLAYRALGAGPGSLVLVPAVTFVATANAALYCGAEVAFVDVEHDSGLLDPQSLARVVEWARSKDRKVAVVTPVHLSGHVADLEAVKVIASRAGARIVEDACHAVGTTYDASDRCSYTVGACRDSDAATFSFHPVKHVTTGEGGAVLTNDGRVANVVRELRSHGIVREPERQERAPEDAWSGPWYYEVHEIGQNYRLTDFQSALGRSQLSKLAGFVERRRALASRYDEALSGDPVLRERFRPLRTREGVRSAYHLYVVQLRDASEGASASALERVARARKNLFLFLRHRGIGTQVHYVPVPWQPFWRQRGIDVGLPYDGARAYYAGSLSLPLFPAMRDEDVDRVVDGLRRWVTDGER